MHEVRLETGDGSYVTTGIMPPFQIWPEVVIWGERVFKMHKAPVNFEPEAVYREVFYVSIVQTKPE